MKSYVAVQKKLLAVIYALWKNNTAFDNHIIIKNIQEKELELFSLSALEKPKKIAILKVWLYKVNIQ